jgi:hypothetical protein
MGAFLFAVGHVRRHERGNRIIRGLDSQPAIAQARHDDEVVVLVSKCVDLVAVVDDLDGAHMDPSGDSIVEARRLAMSGSRRFSR